MQKAPDLKRALSRWPLLLFALAMCICLSGPAVAADPLRLAVSKSHLSLPLYVAQEKGFFASEGLNVKLTDCLGGYRCLRQVLESQADVATAGALPAMFNSFTRSDYAIIGTIATTGDNNKLITHARTGISAPLHLAGKRIGVVPGTSSQYYLELYLLIAGVDPRRVAIVNLQPEDMLAALLADKVDAISVWEPYAYLTMKELSASAVALPRTGAYSESFNLIVHRKMVGARDAELTQLLRAVERAERFIQERPEEAKLILRTRLQLDQGFIDWSWAGMNYRLSIEQSLISTMEGEARWALREGHAKGKSIPNFLALLHTAPLRRIKPDAVGIPQ